MGKSRLYAEARALESAAGVTVLEGRCLSIGQSLSYHPFNDLLKSWLDLAEDGSDAERVEALRTLVADTCQERVAEIVASIGRMMGTELPEDLEEAISGVEGEALEKLIHRSMVTLLESLARRRAVALVIEDLHCRSKPSWSRCRER
jgi:hypothetical protein